MPLSSKGCNATIWEVYNSNPNYQTVKLSTKKKNPPTAEKEFSNDFIDVAYLRNNRTLVKKGDIIKINAFYVQNEYKPSKGKIYYFNITEWELKDKYDYGKLSDIEYKGADYNYEEE